VKYLEGTNHLEFNEQKLKSNKMKPVINNESIKEAHENKINYSLRVDHFYQQAEDASPGAFVDSKPIFIKNSTFTIRIYLNGCDKSKKEGKVYVVVMNSSAFRVRAKALVYIGNNLMPETLCANKFEYWGHSNEIRNARATSKSFRKISFNLDASLKFNVFIKLYEEVSPLALKESETLEMTKIMSNDVASLKEEMMKLKKIATVKLECPVCYEELKPPMRLKQCAQGHIICDECHMKTGIEGGANNRELCHTCRMMYLGRPSVLESLLGLTS